MGARQHQTWADKAGNDQAGNDQPAITPVQRINPPLAGARNQLCDLILSPLLCGLLVLTGGAMAAAAPEPSATVPRSKEPIIVRADRAWEDADKKILHLQGHFRMQTSEWQVEGDRAEVHGPLESPDRIIGYGNPASIQIKMGTSDPVEGSGYSRKIVYQYKEKLLELHDNARLEMDNVTVTSTVILYDAGNRRLISSGSEGVEFQLRPDGRKPSK